MGRCLTRLQGSRSLLSHLAGSFMEVESVGLVSVLSSHMQVARISVSALQAAERNYSANLPPLDPSLLRPRTPPLNYGIRIVPEKTAFVVWG